MIRFETLDTEHYHHVIFAKFEELLAAGKNPQMWTNLATHRTVIVHD